MSRDLKSLLLAAALACTSLPAAAYDGGCRKPEYPRSALNAGAAGVSLLGFLIAADGSATQSTILSSSGNTEMDEDARDAFMRCAFKPATQDGKPIDSWVRVMYVWSLDSDADMLQAKHAAALAASKGDLGARFQLSLLLRATAKTDADREKALTLLRNAADLGQAHAQFELGRRYEAGINGAPKDLDAAMSWYRKAAAQGDVFAVQRLSHNLLPPENLPELTPLKK